MPTDRYLNLPEEKRRLINRAVVSDFRKNHYKDIKVGRIAGQVQLSRSSLYTYFDGKGEMLQLAVEQIWCDFFDFNKKRIVEHHGDYWAMQMDGLEYFLQKNGRMPLNLVMFSYSSNISREYVKWIFHHADRQNMRLKTAEEFASLQDLCHALLNLAVCKYQMGVDIREVKWDFAVGLSHMKTGFLRKEESAFTGDNRG